MDNTILSIFSGIITILFSLIVYIWNINKKKVEKMEEKLDNLDKVYVRKDIYAADMDYLKMSMKEIKDYMKEFREQMECVKLEIMQSNNKNK
jgi:hypothetical protein